MLNLTVTNGCSTKREKKDFKLRKSKFITQLKLKTNVKNLFIKLVLEQINE